MQATRRLWQHRQPMIHFLGKRSAPKQIDHTPHAHPQSPEHSLPESFAQYRNRVTQHGPLGGQQPREASPSSSGPAPSSLQAPYGSIGGRSAQQLGSVKPGAGEVWDRDELPARFRRRAWTTAEMDAVDSGGASLFA